MANMTPQIAQISPIIIANPYGESAKGRLIIFIPIIPDTMVGTAMINVIEVKYFMELFNRLSITEDISSLVPLMISL